MKALDPVSRILGVLVVGLVVVIFLFVILHRVRSEQYKQEWARLDALEILEADGFAGVEIIAQEEFVETRTCWDFEISFVGSGGQPMWGHLMKCDPSRSEGQGMVDYVMKDLCAKDAIDCSPDWKDKTYDCAEDSDCE